MKSLAVPESVHVPEPVFSSEIVPLPLTMFPANSPVPAVEPLSVKLLAPTPVTERLLVNLSKPVPDCSSPAPPTVPDNLMTLSVVSPVPV